MKIAFTALFLSLVSLTSYSQSFNLTPSGFVSSADSTKNFIVVDAAGLSQAQLYKHSMLYLSSLYVSPKDVLSTIDNESITVNAIAKKAIKMKVLYLNPSWDVDYTITFQFKDGRMRILQPSVNGMNTFTGDLYRTASIRGGSGRNHKEIYNGKGELKQKDGKENLELFINSYLHTAATGIIAVKEDKW